MERESIFPDHQGEQTQVNLALSANSKNIHAEDTIQIMCTSYLSHLKLT